MRGVCGFGVLLGACLVLLGPAAGWAQNDRSEADPDDIGTTTGDAPITGAPNDRRAASQLERLRNTAPVVQAGPVDPQHYVLGPGDVIELGLWGRFARTVLLTVNPEGTVFLPGAGPIAVSGRTLAWARERILERVAQTFRGVHAEARLIQLRMFKVYVAGFVKQPGAVVVNSVTRASEAIQLAQIVDNGSRRNIEIQRHDGTVLRVDLELFENAARQQYDPTLVDGDLIRVPRAVRFLGLSGAVEKSGPFEYAPGDSLSTLLGLGGGLLPAAAPEPALLVRFSSPSERDSMMVDLSGVLAGRGDFPLQDGDHLFVQYRSDFHILPSVSIVGEVERPGTYPIVQGRDRFGDVIRRAGGFRPLANRSGIHLLRESSAGQERDPEFDRLVRLSRSEMTESEYVKFQTMVAERKNSFRIDWSRIQKESPDVNPLLQTGDIIRVEQYVPTVRVEGEVKRPGLVDFVPGRGLEEYVELSGGYTDRASRTDIRVSRSLTGQVIPGRSVANVQPGDFVWVPERKDVDAWAVFRDAIAIVGQVAVVVFTLSR